MNTEDQDKMFREKLSENMIGDTARLIIEASGGDYLKAMKIKKHVLDIVKLGNEQGGPDEFYIAIFILAMGIEKVDKLTNKWINENEGY